MYDAAADLRLDSLTLGRWRCLTLPEDNPVQRLIPHGFLVLGDVAGVCRVTVSAGDRQYGGGANLITNTEVSS